MKEEVFKIKECLDKEDLKNILVYVRNKITNNRAFSFFLIKNKIVADKIKSLYLYNDSIKESVYRLINNIEYDVLCECGNRRRFIDNNRGYQSFCGDKKCKFVNLKKNEKSSNTFNVKYGGHPMSTDLVKEKLKKSINDKYGYDSYTKYLVSKDLYISPFSKKETWLKTNSTWNDKYGGHPMQNTDVFSNNIKSRLKFKDYILPSGKIARIQGYENLALDYLLSKYGEEDILYSVKEINNTIGSIHYTYLGKNRKYYPDFFIKSCNKIYEVKSTWTFKSKENQNLLKKEKCIELGLSFEFLIFKDGKLV